MDEVDNFIHSFLEEHGDVLAHYASEYYDPVKAREYYLRTRELKGRRSGAGLKTKKKKQAWAFAQKNIKEAEQREVATATFLKADFIKKTRELAAAKRKEWSEMLKEILGDRGLAGEKKQWTEEHAAKKKAALDAVSAKAKTEIGRIKQESEAELERIQKKIEQTSSETARKIAALPEIPKGISSERRAQLAAERAEEIARIIGDADQLKSSLRSDADKVRKDASSARKTVVEEASSERKSITDKFSREQKAFNEKVASVADEEREAIRKKREEVAAELKATVDKARSDYETLKQDLKAKYEQVSDREYEAIRRQV